MFSDLALVTQVAVLHNKRAFDQLVRKYQSPVRRFLLNLTLGNEALTEDLAQDTFLKAYEHMGQFRGRSSLQTWLFRIAYNAFYDYKRKENGKVKNEDLDSAGPAVESMAAAKTSLSTSSTSLRIDIHTALATLKDEERTCITLQFIDGQSIDEIARITGLPQNTVKSHLKRGKDKLKTYLKENGYDG